MANKAQLQAALETFGEAFEAYHDRHVGRKTAHNGECTGIILEVCPPGVGFGLNGFVKHIGARISANPNPSGMENVVNSVFTEDTSLIREFSSAVELAQILQS